MHRDGTDRSRETRTGNGAFWQVEHAAADPRSDVRTAATYGFSALSVISSTVGVWLAVLEPRVPGVEAARPTGA
jgi:hypothetical protein